MPAGADSRAVPPRSVELSAATLVSAEPLALDGGAPLRTRPWPAWPVWDQSDLDAVSDVIRGGKWFSGSGSRNGELAERFAGIHHARHALSCCNGTQAIEIALRACGIHAGDEVITSPYTFIATVSATINVNAVPVFADVEDGTLNLDPASVEASVTKRTRAILAVHVAGCPADLDGLSEVARRHGLLLLEDAAQAHLSEWRGRRVGAIGAAGTFSFQASKNLNAGEGGMIVTDDDEIWDRAWSLVNCGRVRAGGWYEHRMLSGNYRLSELSAALLLSQMSRLDEQSRRREENALYLASQLAKIEGIQPLTRDHRVTRHSYHLFIFRYRQEQFGGRLDRDGFIQALKAEGVPCSPGYSPLYRSPAFRIEPGMYPCVSADDYRKVSLPRVERACAEAVWLSQFLLLGDRSDMDDIVAAIRKIQRAVRR